MTPAAARLDRVTKRYGDVVALKEVDLTIGSGVTALLGPNGAGKTTAVKLMLGLAKPTTGTVTVCGGVGLDPSSGAGHLFALGVSTLLFLGLAAVGFARDEGKTYG